MHNGEVPAKKQKAKSVLIFSAITALFVGIVGYESIKENRTNDVFNTPEKKIPILSNFTRDSYHKPDKVELALLNAQNHHFSNKIIALKEEAHENSKRLHAIQIALITAEKEKDNQQILKLKENLLKDRELSEKLHENLSKLQNEIQEKESEIVNLESTIDRLNNLLGSEQLKKEELRQHFENEIQIVENKTKDESQSLKNQLSTLQEEKTDLEKKIQEQIAYIEKLEDETTKRELALLDKELEADAIVQEYRSKEKESGNESKNLSFVLETEQLTTKHLQKELHYLESELAVTLQKIKEHESLFRESQAENEKKQETLNLLNQELLKKDQLLSYNSNEHELTKQNANQTLKELTETHIHQLHDTTIKDDLLVTLTKEVEQYKTELEHLKALHNSLSHDRNALKNHIEEKNQALKTLEENLAYTNEQHQAITQAHEENIQKLNASLEKELEKTKDLENSINRYEALLKEHANLREEEKNYSLEFQKQLEALSHELQQKEHELSELKEVSSLKQQSNEELSELLSFHEGKLIGYKETLAESFQLKEEIEKLQKLIEEKENFERLAKENKEGLENELKNLKEILEIRENELILTQEAFENKNALHQELYSQFEKEKEDKTKVQLEFDQLNQILTKKESELQNFQEMSALTNETNNQLNALVAFYEEKISNLESSESEKLLLNQKIREELEQYQKALENALILQDEEKKNAKDVEEKLKELEELYRQKENELSSTKETASSTEQINLNLAKEIEETKLKFENSLKAYEEAQNKTIENEKNLHELSEALLFREKELTEIRSLYHETEINNQKLSEEIQKQNQILNDSIEKYNQAELKAVEAEKNLLELSLRLKSQENALVDISQAHLSEKNKNKELSDELLKHQQELSNALLKYEETRRETNENEKELHDLIQLLVGRENLLLKAVEEKENNLLQQKETESENKNLINKLEQSRQNLQNELEKARASYATLVNSLNETTNVSDALSHHAIKSHTVTPGDTLRGIALRYYGSPNRWREIYQANKDQILNQDKIPVGTVLRIP